MKKESHAISVIVPVYNKEAYLRECIDSILGQTYQHLELILVDDASTDGSGAVCDEYGRLDGRVTVLHQKNAGPTSACVAGMKAAKGGYYMFVDSDDFIERDTLAHMAARLTGQRGEVVCCNHVLEKQKGTEAVYSLVPAGVYTGRELETKIKDNMIGRERKVIPMSRCMKLCEKSVFDDNEKYYDFDIRFGDDTNLMYPAMLNSKRVVIMEGALYYHYRYVEGSIIHRYDEGIYESVQKLMVSLERAAADKQVHDAAQVIARERCYMLLYVLKNELRNPGREYRAKIQEIFRAQAVRETILTTPLEIKERSNALLYLGMRYPEKGLIRLLRLVFKVYDRRR